MSRAGPLWAGSAGARFWRGWWVLHTRAHRVLVGTAESCGTATPVTTTIPLPCAQTTLTAHRSPTTTHHAHQRNPQSQQKNSPRPAKAPVSHVQHPRHPHPKHTPTTPHTEIGPLPARDRSDSARPTRRRSTHDKLKGESHMPHLKTISKQQTRGSTTDLDTKPDRSRCGFRPISTRRCTDLGERRAEGRARPWPLGVGRRRREETATPTPLALFPCQAREMREASSTCSGVGRTPV